MHNPTVSFFLKNYFFLTLAFILFWSVSSQSYGQTCSPISGGANIIVTSSCSDLVMDSAGNVAINAGVIISSSSDVAISITNGVSTKNLTINGNLSGRINVDSLSSLNQIINNGTITTSNGGINVWGNVNTVVNNGQLISAGWWGVQAEDGATITNLINTGSILAFSAVGLNGQILYITNTGTINSSSADQDIMANSYGPLVLNNSQGSGNTYGRLTYRGILPNNYNIIINSTSNYGRLWVTSGTGNTTFGISSLSAGSSTVSGTAYTSVLKGITNTQLGTSGASITGTSNSYTYTLTRTDAVENIWDLIVSGFSGSSGGGASSTYRSNAIAALRSHAAGAAGVLDSLTNNAQFAGVITALDALSGTAQANAVAQTLPVITGAASQATTAAMQALNQVIQGRSSSLRGMSSGDEYIGNRDVWMKGFGSWANQNDINGVSGYKINTGGLAIGIDKGLTRKANIGAVFAFSNSGVSSNSSSAPSGVTVNSYQAGVYGDYAIHPQLIANAQLDVGMNQNNAYRNITFMGTNANSSYNSYSGHVGTGVKYLMPLSAQNTFIPSVRVDYTTVQSQAYTETGAGALNLSVGQQTYNTLIPSADMRIDHSLDSKLTLSANAGAGYNTLGNQVTSTAAYQGGGAVFATNGLEVSPWLYNAGVGITGQIEKNMQLNVRYDNVFSPTGYMNQMVSAKLKIPF
jgi:outer membrane autotransporter protein